MEIEAFLKSEEAAAMPRARVARMVRDKLDAMKAAGVGGAELLAATEKCLEWATEHKNTFLRLRLELRACELLAETTEGRNRALERMDVLVRELKKLDDKLLLVEALLLESKMHRDLRSTARAKSALTTARTNATGVYCPQELAASLDVQNGLINADEKDYGTAFSYFFEAFEAYVALNKTEEAALTLKHMLLCKVMAGKHEDFPVVLTAKSSRLFAKDKGVEAMKEVSRACLDRSLAKFSAVGDKYPKELKEDPFVTRNFEILFNDILENNLVRLIEPFSCVEIAHIAELIGIDAATVEKKLSQMILDKRINGILDQGVGQLILFEDAPAELPFTHGLQTMANLNGVVDALFAKTKHLA